MRHLVGLLLIAILLLTITVSIVSSQTPTPQAADISCPRSKIVWLEGEGPPAEAVLVFLEQRAVGGGTIDRSGRWRVPLRMQEDPGIYPIEVRTRNNRTLVGRFTCYVDTPLGSTPTLSPTAGQVNVPTATPGSSGNTPTPSRSPQPTSSTPSPTGGTQTTTASAGTRTPTATNATPGTATVTTTTTTTTTPGTTTPTTTPTTQTLPTNAVQIVEVFVGDPDPNANPPDNGFVVVEKFVRGDLDLTGWTIENGSRANSPKFTFPQFKLDDSNAEAIVYTDKTSQDIDDPVTGEFYWGTNQRIWNVGEVAVLRNAQGTEVHRFNIR